MRKFFILLALNTYLLATVQSVIAQENQEVSIQEDIQLALEIHNNARREVGVPPLSWSEELAKDATEYAEELARIDKLVHSKCGDGENLYWCSWETVTPFSNASNSWYEEIEKYSRVKISWDNFRGTGHYTQMVWSKTAKVGMGYATTSSGTTYVVARYDPQGNWIGSYPY